MKRSWLISLSLGVLIIVLAVVLLTLWRKINTRQLAMKTTQSPTPTYTFQPSNTELPTTSPLPTNTLISTNTPLPEIVLGVGSTKVRDIDGMEMVYVPEGIFTMGSKNGDSDEIPVREVYLDAYWIDKYEVSNVQYAKCVAEGRCSLPSQINSSKRDIYYGNPAYDNYPVVWVDWNQASTYCAWVGGRLPSEAEWEKAARGPEGNKYPWGNENPSLELTNYKYNIGDTTAVDSYPMGKSYYGAFNMAGNVWEWVNDWYANLYNADQLNNPPGPISGSSRVLRGGSWRNSSGEYADIRSAYRYYGDPSYGGSYWGFRCAFPEK